MKKTCKRDLYCLWFVRPKPEYNCQDMEVFIIEAKDKDEVWDIMVNDEPSDDREYFKENYQIIELDKIIKNKPQVIWGYSTLGYGL